MEEGTLNRTVASTNMNATSSRAHTIVGIHFIQKSKNASGKEMAKAAVVNLVDLAGRYGLDSSFVRIHGSRRLGILYLCLSTIKS